MKEIDQLREFSKTLPKNYKEGVIQRTMFTILEHCAERVSYGKKTRENKDKCKDCYYKLLSVMCEWLMCGRTNVRKKHLPTVDITHKQYRYPGDDGVIKIGRAHV